MFKKLTVAVIFGGRSTEYDVSLQSASSVIAHLDREKYEVIQLGITRSGEWLRYDGPIEGIADDTWHRGGSCTRAVISPSTETHGLLQTDENGSVKIVPIDVAFPVLHGKNGEDGTMQGLLELAGIPYVGCDVLSSAMCMDKDVAHKLAELAGVPVPRSVTAYKNQKVASIILRASALDYPLFVKPARSGSSLGISRVDGPNGLEDAIAQAFLHDNKLVIEEAVDGFEVGCAVIGNESLMVGEVDEIELAHGFFDYHEKYNLQTSKIHLPARLDAPWREEIKRTALALYRALECRGFARVDMFVQESGRIVFNEINTIPGCTGHSRYPSMLAAAGMPFGRMVDELILLALEV
ncbi:MAG: D-alanine--D-serine ligase VanG [Christensenellales bacterium]|jgi:D-alanine---D-serine ligase